MKLLLLSITLLISNFSWSQSFTNGDFEDQDNGWLLLVNDNVVGSFTIEGSDVNDGVGALLCQVDMVGPNAWDMQAIYETAFELEVGTNYTITFYGKSATSSTARIIMQGNGFLSTDVSFSESWQEYSWTFTAAEVAPQFKIHFPEEGTFLFDDFSIVESAPCLEEGTNPSVDFTSLKDLASFPIGAAIATVTLWNTDAYFFQDQIRPNIAKQHFNILVAENSMKMGVIANQEGVYRFSDGDDLVEFAEENDMLVHGHALLWHSSTPDWVVNYDGDYEELMLDYITDVATHYKGKITSWDVVNEAFTDGANSDHREESVWFSNIGPTYIEKAFAKAAEIDPEADLYYNDYSLVWGGEKLNRVIEMIEDLQAKNVPIHGVGMQAHISGVNECLFRESMEKLVATGLKIRLSELDIKTNDNGEAITLTEEMAEQQAHEYRKIAALYKEVVPVEQQGGILFWGMGDRDSWLKPDEWPLLWDDDFNEKPALQGFADGLSDAIGDYSGYIEGKLDQQITGFELEDTYSIGDMSFDLIAASSSGLEVSFATSDESVVSIDGTIARIHSTGTVTITSSQSGNETYNPSTPVSYTITITDPPLAVRPNKDQVILYPNPATDHIIYNNESGLRKWSIFQLNGKMIMTGKDEVIDVTQLQTGIYLFRSGEWTSKFYKR